MECVSRNRLRKANTSPPQSDDQCDQYVASPIVQNMTKVTTPQSHNSSRLSPSKTSTKEEDALTWNRSRNCYRPHRYLQVQVFNIYDKPDAAYLDPGAAYTYPGKYSSVRIIVGPTRNSSKQFILHDKLICLITWPRDKSLGQQLHDWIVRKAQQYKIPHYYSGNLNHHPHHVHHQSLVLVFSSKDYSLAFSSMAWVLATKGGISDSSVSVIDWSRLSWS